MAKLNGKPVALIDVYAEKYDQRRLGEWLPMWRVVFEDGTEKKMCATHRAECMSEADAKEIAKRHAKHFLGGFK